MKALLRGWEPSKTRPLTLPTNFEPDYMNERPKMAAECQLVDDGSGERTLWRIEQKEDMIQVEDKGIYYAEACYVMLYKYGQGRRCQSIVREISSKRQLLYLTSFHLTTVLKYNNFFPGLLLGRRSFHQGGSRCSLVSSLSFIRGDERAVSKGITRQRAASFAADLRWKAEDTRRATPRFP